MSARLIDGKRIALETRLAAGRAAAELLARTGVVPGLATVLVGEDPASAVYVGSKERACKELGIASFGFRLPASASQAELEAQVDALNARPDVHGILVQMPLPEHLDSDAIIDRIHPRKDVDGFNTLNVGLLAQRGRKPDFVACTPAGVMVLLEHTGLTIAGMDAVVLGRSNIVGLPMAMLLQRADATVTVCHSRTRHLADHLRRADLVVAAIGRPEYVRADMLKPGVVVVDVGINRVPDPTTSKGYRLVGDVDFAAAREVASWITPVPGGVGPMTIATLLANTLRAAELQDAAR
ncbi:MAG: bifunctional methylenetetrahydrofolate dehydrogenase/methenyltetrahydrofolate cyclohydrolase FolD [Anaerolineae bacterium]